MWQDVASPPHDWTSICTMGSVGQNEPASPNLLTIGSSVFAPSARVRNTQPHRPRNVRHRQQQAADGLTTGVSK